MGALLTHLKNRQWRLAAFTAGIYAACGAALFGWVKLFQGRPWWAPGATLTGVVTGIVIISVVADSLKK